MVDTGSSAMLDMTYTSQAALYIGDVSSQVYEFLGIPRPCVFLNPRKLPWRDDPYFLHWTLGEVVEDLDDLMPAIARARERHAAYRPAQESLFQETFGTPLLGDRNALRTPLRSSWLRREAFQHSGKLTARPPSDVSL